MTESLEQQIKRIEDKAKARQQADERSKADAEQKAKQAEELKKQVREKWVKDTHEIAAILVELKDKMPLSKVDLSFQDRGSPGDAVAAGLIAGRVANKPVEMA